jgi:hypothetical protein
LFELIDTHLPEEILRNVFVWLFFLFFFFFLNSLIAIILFQTLLCYVLLQ